MPVLADAFDEGDEFVRGDVYDNVYDKSVMHFIEIGAFSICRQCHGATSDGAS